MTDDVNSFPKKHLARNIPEDFSACCTRIKDGKLNGFNRSKVSDFESLYWRMFAALSDEPLESVDQRRIGENLHDIQVRFLTIQKTVDRSVPASPVYNALRQLNRLLNKITLDLDDPDRDRVVDELSENDNWRVIQKLEVKFEQTKNLAEKVTTVHRHLKEISEDLKPIEDYFDYKSGLVTRGNPSKYAMLFAVHALAEIFEKENTHGHRASVNEFFDGGRHGTRGKNYNRRRYTGKFLDFVSAFYGLVVPEQASFRQFEGFADQVRKFAKRRSQDPGLHCLLMDDPVSIENILEFMTRADALK